MRDVIMELEIIIDESRLNWPRRKIYAGVLSSLDVIVKGVPMGVSDLEIRFDAAGRDRPISARGRMVQDGVWHVYAMPFCFPSAAGDLKYEIVCTDEGGNARWLGTGALAVLACSAAGSGEEPQIVPRDTYLRNPVTGLYHRLVAEVDEDGVLTVAVDQEGVEK